MRLVFQPCLSQPRSVVWQAVHDGSLDCARPPSAAIAELEFRVVQRIVQSGRSPLMVLHALACACAASELYA